MGHETLDRTARRRHKLRNLAHSALLLAGMVGLLFVISWLLLGRDLALWALAGWVLALIWAPRISPQIVMRMYRARPLGPAEFPAGHDLLARLAARAGLPRAPRLYYVPSAALNAFTLGGKADAVVSVTDGLLRSLTLRELAGVLAHEISHIRNNDLWVMSLADSISRLTSFFSFAGVMLLFLSVPMMLLQGSLAPLVVAVILIVAPTFASLLQLALSRAREFDADLEAAGLTGDPEGLASALRKLEQHQAGLWERVFLPGRRIPDPSLFRSHPSTEERVARLLSLAPDARRAPFAASDRPAVTSGIRPVIGRPRWRYTGLWH
ncbi:MAG: zinc metalloprotease HtpX [Kiloniellales bacterium]|nr:zinc metalloprotease HtpX [Kiloniellales bacterium]